MSSPISTKSGTIYSRIPNTYAVTVKHTSTYIISYSKRLFWSHAVAWSLVLQCNQCNDVKPHIKYIWWKRVFAVDVTVILEKWLIIPHKAIVSTSFFFFYCINFKGLDNSICDVWTALMAFYNDFFLWNLTTGGHHELSLYENKIYVTVLFW